MYQDLYTYYINNNHSYKSLGYIKFGLRESLYSTHKSKSKLLSSLLQKK